MQKKFSLIVVLLTAICGYATAQSISNYTFTSPTLAFTNISGGTSPTLSAGTDDEGYFNAIPIGFDFWYMGTRYTSISASTNGWLTVGVDWTIQFALAVGGGASFNAGSTIQNIYGSLTNNGTITSSGILNFIPATATTLNMGSIFSSTGLVNFGGAGAITLSGAPLSFNDVNISNTNTVGFVGVSTQNVSGSSPTNFSNITVTNISNPGVSIQSDQNLLGILTLATNVFFDADGSGNTSVFTLLSTDDDPTGDASVAILPAGSRITGRLTVQRFMTKEGYNNTRIYRYISSPVQYGTVSDLQNEIPVTGPFPGTSICSGCQSKASMFSYNESSITDSNGNGVIDLNDGYAGFPTSSNNEILSPGTGYALYVRGDLLSNTSWDLRGTINTGNIIPVSLPVTYTSSSVSADDGWNLIGNPFPSTIDWNSSNGWTKTNLGGAIYTTDNGSASLQYATWNGATGTNGGSRYIATGQAFWIKANGLGVPALQTDEKSKAPGTQATFFREGTTVDLLRITMRQGAVRDEAVIHFRPDATPGFDSNADAWKLKNVFINISSLSEDGERLAINSWSALTCGISIKLDVDQIPAGSYLLVFTNLDSFDSTVEVTLKDQFLDQLVQLTDQQQYQFNITDDEHSYGSERFLLKFNKRSPPVDIQVSEGILSVNYVSGIQWYLDGLSIPGATQPALAPTETGTYSVVVISNGCILTGSLEFLVTGISESWLTGLNVYPNPTSGEVFITSESGGINSIYLVNILGQAIDEIQLERTDHRQKEKFQIEKNASGVYLLKIITDKTTYIIKILKE
ncbi:MAG: T9SS type A sorting domain-containing protein [Bacteroidota bacterium]